jgi:hypothetical protein
MAVAAVMAWMRRDTREIILNFLIVLSIPAFVGAPLIVLSDPPWNWAGSAILATCCAGLCWLFRFLFRRWRLRFRGVLSGPLTIAVGGFLLLYALGLYLSFCAGYFQDPDWAFQWIIGAIAGAALQVLLGTLVCLGCALVGARRRAKR